MHEKQTGQRKKCVSFRVDPFSEGLGMHEKQTGRHANAFLLELTTFQKDMVCMKIKQDGK